MKDALQTTLRGFLGAALLLQLPAAAQAQGVGIGTASPTAGAALDVRGTTLVSGALGIGTSAPVYLLDASTAGNLAGRLSSSSPIGTWFNLANTDTGGGGFTFISTGSQNGGGPNRLQISAGTDGSTSGGRLILDGNTGFFLLDNAAGPSPLTRLSLSPNLVEPKLTLYDGGNATNHYGFGVSAAQLNYHVNNASASHVFYAGGKNGPDGNSTELLRVQGNGRVGIGTSNPAQLLELGATDRAQPSFARLSAGNGAASRQWDLGLALNAANPTDITGENYDFALRDASANATRLLVEWNTGNVGIGTAAPAARLDVAGGIRCVGLSQTSDQRLKTNLRPLAGALAGALALRGVRYRWNAEGQRRGGAAGAEQIGLLAQEVEKIYPELVTTGADGYKAVNYAQLAPVLLEALRELKRDFDQAQAGAAAARKEAQNEARAATAATAALLRRVEAIEAPGPRAGR